MIKKWDMAVWNALVILTTCAAAIGCGQSIAAVGNSPSQLLVLSSSQMSARAGEVISLTASLGGMPLSGGMWTVEGGVVNGTIDASGLYRAPAIAPPSSTILINYVKDKLSSTTTISVLNPIPVVVAVSPAVLKTFASQIAITGTGFVTNSVILVNGAPIRTSYVDNSHLLGQVALASSTSTDLQVAVSNPDPGASLSVGFHVQIAPPLSTPVPQTRTLHTPSYFMEQSDEFVGPFPSWTNVKTAFGAVGDGVTDDTAAIQQAINSLTYTSPSCVLFVPAGTYKISSTLVMGHMNNFSIIGESPLTTTVKWAGAIGGTMLLADGSTYFRISRLAFDGSNIADFAEDLTRVKVYDNAFYSTFNELSDQHIFGVNLGIHLGIDAETTIERVFFDHLPTAGISLGDFNTINIFVNDSFFLHCGTGLTNVYQNGAGSFVVSNSFFAESQIADMSIANTGLFTARHNTSVKSRMFFLSYEIYNNSGAVTLQNNTIQDPSTTPFQFGNLGPFMLIDNVVRTQNSAIPIIEASWTSSLLKDVFSIGNTYTPNGGMGTGDLPFQGRVVSYDDTTVPVSSIADVDVPSNVYVPLNLHRLIFEPSALTGTAIQAAITLAAKSQTLRPVVHLTKANYQVSSTIMFPPASDIQLIGDDVFRSSLSWTGTVAAPVLFLPTSNVSVRNLRVEGAGEGSSDGLLLSISDQPNTQVIMDQADLGESNSYGVSFDGMEHATLELFSTYTTGSITGVKVTGGAFRAAKEGTIGVSNHYTGSLQSKGTGTSFDVSAGGKYMVQDNWHDYGSTSPQNFRLSGSGTVTEQGGGVYMNSSTPFEIDNFSGNVTLMGLGFTGGFNLASTSGQANLLNLGLVGNSSTYLPLSTPTVTVGNVLNSYSGVHIAQAATPDVAWMRGMLAQTRSEYPIARPALTAGANRIRLNRIWVGSASSAIHVKPDSVKSGLYYVLRSAGSNLVNMSGACVSTTFLNSSDQWLLMAAGEGDFEVVSKSSGKALGVAATANPTLTLEPLTGEYDQRWMINKLGTGDFSLSNRQSGSLLSLPAPGACAGIGSGGSINWTLTAY